MTAAFVLMAVAWLLQLAAFLVMRRAERRWREAYLLLAARGRGGAS